MTTTTEARYVYLVAAPNGLYKIGQSYDPEKRAGWMARKSVGLKVVHSVRTNEATTETERILHGSFAHRCVKGEWFRLRPGEVEIIKGLSNEGGPGAFVLALVGLRQMYEANAAKGFLSEEPFSPDDLAFLNRRDDTEPLRMPGSVVRRIRRVAAHLRKDPGDYVAERFDALLDKDEKKMLEDIERERKGESQRRRFPSASEQCRASDGAILPASSTSCSAR